MNKKITIIEKQIEGEAVKIQAKEVSIAHSFKIIDEEKGMFEAHVSIFGNVDSYGEIVDKGAFTEWLTQYAGRYPKGVWAHDWSQPIIKTLECREDEIGLYVKGQFVLEVQRAREIYALMKEGVITDFSFGFRVMEDSWDEVAKVRHLKKIAIYEYSPVLVGANSEATLIGVKADGAPVDPPANADAPAADPTPTPTPAPTPDVPADPPANEPGKSGNAPSRKALVASAIDVLVKAIDALEALQEATEDDDSGKSSDTSRVEGRDGKGDPNTMKVVARAFIRDARKADQVIERMIIRAKEIL